MSFPGGHNPPAETPNGDLPATTQGQHVCHHGQWAQGPHRPQGAASTAARLWQHPMPPCAIPCCAMPCHAMLCLQTGPGQGAGPYLRCGSLWAVTICPSPDPAHTKQGQCWSRQAEAGLVLWLECGHWAGPGANVRSGSCVYPQSRRAFSFLRFPLQFPLRAASCSPPCCWPEPGAAKSPARPRREHPTVLGREVPTLGPAVPFPPGSSHGQLVPTHGSHREDGSPTPVPVTGREQRCRAEKPQCPGVSWAGGPRSPEPPGSAGLGKGEGTEPPPRAPAGPCPLGWGSRSSSSRPDTRLPAAEAVP